MEERQKRKLKGGAEKVRLKRKKMMEEEAWKCSKITDMFRATTSKYTTGEIN